MFVNFADYEYFVTVGLCVLALLGMGTTLTVDAFREVAGRPRCLLLILVSQLLIGPLVVLGLNQLFLLPPGIAVGMLLVTSLPGGLFSNVFALLSRSHVALSVSATALCTFGSLITTTLVLKTFGSQHLPEQFDFPIGYILYEITVSLLLPLVAGMSLRHFFPKRSRSIGRGCVRAATLLLVYYITAAFQSGRISPAAYGWHTHASIILLIVLQVILSGLLSWPFRVTSLEIYTCQIEIVIRNIHLGLLLKASLFPAAADTDGVGAGVLFVLLYYGGASIITGMIMLAERRIGLHIQGDAHRAPPPPELSDW